jgi:hypothetical protein
MANVPPGVPPQALYVASRRVLLDALDALTEHHRALTLVGAHAVYLRTGAAHLGIAATTSDSDLGLDPDLVASTPFLEAALTHAGFTRAGSARQPQPGTWWRTQEVSGISVPIAVDLLAPQTLTSGGRGARIPPHDRAAVRRVPGLELTVIDHEAMTITSLDPDTDPRTVELNMAGVAALLVAKAHKINDRVASLRAGRLNDKDAADVYRMFATADPSATAATFQRLLEHPRVGEITRSGLGMLHDQFGAARTVGVDMAARALAGSIPQTQVRRVAPAFISELPQP